jgi:uncharacterized membrane protein YgcG
MKKFGAILLSVIAAVMILSLPVFAEDAPKPETGDIYLIDNADLLRHTDEEEILKAMNEVAYNTGWNIVIATEIGQYSSNEAESELRSIYRDKFGNSDGVGYIMTTEVDKPEGQNDFMLAIHTFGSARMQSTENQILDAVERPFLDYNEYGSAMAFLGKCQVYQSNAEKFRLEPFRLIFPGFFYGAIPAMICVIVVTIRYKSHPKVSATRYLNLGDSRFWRRGDTFIREFTTRTPINNGGSGGGRSGGGGFSGSASRGGRR